MIYVNQIEGAEVPQNAPVDCDGSLMDARKKCSSSQRDTRSIVASLGLVLIISQGSGVEGI